MKITIERAGGRSLTLNLRRLLAILLLVVIGVAAGVPALSQPASPEEVQGPTPEEIADSFPEKAMQKTMALIAAMEALVTQVSTGGVFNALGRRIAAVLGAVVIIWSILKNMVLKASVNQIIADLVFPLIVMAMCVAALDHDFAGKVNASVQGLMAGLAPSVNANGNSVAVGFVQGMLKAITSVWTQSPAFTIKDIGFTYLGSLLLQLFAVVFIALGTAIGLGTIFMAKFQIAFAIALAPVMIPWALFRPTEFLFSGWLTFLLKGGFILVAVSAIAGAINNSVAGLNTIAAGSVAGIDSAMAYGAIAILSVLFAFLLYQSAEIGSGVISGGVSGISGFARVASSGASPMGAVGKLAGKSMAGASGLGAALALGRLQKGKSDGQLSPLQKSMQPRRGSYRRAVYEWGRDAPPPGPQSAPAGPTGGTP